MHQQIFAGKAVHVSLVETARNWYTSYYRKVGHIEQVSEDFMGRRRGSGRRKVGRKKPAHVREDSAPQVTDGRRPCAVHKGITLSPRTTRGLFRFNGLPYLLGIGHPAKS